MEMTRGRENCETKRSSFCLSRHQCNNEAGITELEGHIDDAEILGYFGDEIVHAKTDSLFARGNDCLPGECVHEGPLRKFGCNVDMNSENDASFHVDGLGRYST